MHASAIEYVFVGLSLCAVASQGWFFIQSVRTAQDYAREGKNGPERVVATDKQRGNGMRLMSATTALVGAIAILFVMPPPPPYSMMPQSLILIAVLIVKQCITVFSSWLSWQSQHKLDAYIDRANPDKPKP